MSWDIVARKDFEDAIRSRWLWGLSVLFIAVFSIPAVARFYFGTAPGGSETPGQGVTAAFVFLIKEGTAVFVPLIAIVIAYAAITKERESGTMKLLLSLPHSRRDVVLGKVVGRSGVIVAPVLVGFLVALVLLVPVASAFSFVKYLQFAFLTAFLGVVFVGISVGVSAAADSDRQALVASIAIFLVGTFFWNPIASRLADGIKNIVGFGTESRYLTLLVFKLINPIQAYKTLVDSMIQGSAMAARKLMFGFFIFQDPKAIKALGDTLPVYATDPFVYLYLLAWLVVPVAVGLWVFEEKDL